MPKLPLFITCCLGLCYSFILEVKAVEATSTYSNAIVAEVQGEIITERDLMREMQSNEFDISNLTPDERIEVKKECLSHLVEKILVRTDFQAKKFQLPQAITLNEEQSMIQTNFNNNRKEFYEALKVYGKTPNQFRKEIETNQILNIMREQSKSSHFSVSPAQIEHYYKQHRDQYKRPETIALQQITLKGSLEENKETLDTIYAELKNGKAFLDLAKQYGGPSKPLWVEKKDLSPLLQTKVSGLKKGEYSQAIVDSDLIFILFIADIKASDYLPLESVQKEIEGILRKEIEKANYQRWLESLSKKYHVRILPEELR